MAVAYIVTEVVVVVTMVALVSQAVVLAELY